MHVYITNFSLREVFPTISNLEPLAYVCLGQSGKKPSSISRARSFGRSSQVRMQFGPRFVKGS